MPADPFGRATALLALPSLAATALARFTGPFAYMPTVIGLPGRKPPPSTVMVPPASGVPVTVMVPLEFGGLAGSAMGVSGAVVVAVAVLVSVAVAVWVGAVKAYVASFTLVPVNVMTPVYFSPLVHWAVTVYAPSRRVSTGSPLVAQAAQSLEAGMVIPPPPCA